MSLYHRRAERCSWRAGVLDAANDVSARPTGQAISWEASMSRVRNVVAMMALGAALAIPGSAQAIVGGSDAAPGEFPEIAEVQLGKAFLCSGTLIDSTHVLTAGHCGSL